MESHLNPIYWIETLDNTAKFNENMLHGEKYFRITNV